MRRVMLKVVVFLLIGAAINVGVAWGCALWSPIHRESPPSCDMGSSPGVAAVLPKEWLTPSPGHGFFTYHRDSYGSPGLRVDRMGVGEQVLGANSPLAPGRIVHVHEAGWPWYTMTCTGYLDLSMVPRRSRPAANPQHWEGGFVAPGILRARTADGASYWFRYQHPLPLRPIWPAFLGNALVYALGAFALATLPGAMRGMIRRARGRCAACAYPVGVSDVCTECGRPVRAKEAAA